MTIQKAKFERDNEIKNNSTSIEKQPVPVEMEEFRNVLQMESHRILTPDELHLSTSPLIVL